MKIVIFPTQGFCNRLRGIASTHILASFLGVDYFVNWEPEECCNCSIDDVFSTTFNRIELSEIQKSNYLFAPNTHTNNIMDNIKEEEYDYIVIQGGHEFKHPEMSCVDFLKRKHEFHKSLKFTESIENRVSEVDTTDCIGIHFRDYIPKYDKLDGRIFSEVSPLTSFVDIAKSIHGKNPGVRFFVSSNTNTAMEKISESTSPENVMELNDLETDRSSKEGIIDSVVNVLVLSKCRFIVGTSMSSYSDEACFFNNISKLCISNELANDYHCYGFGNILGYNMLLPDFHILYDVFGV